MAANSSGILMVTCNTYSGAEIGLFYANSNLTFQGLVQFKVIAGLVNLYGHTFQPSTVFYDACPLQTQLNMTALSVDEATVLKQKDYAVAINSVPLVFRQAKHVETLGKAVVDLSGEDCTRPLLYIEVELNQTDCRKINNYIERDLTPNLCAVVVFRELRSNTVEILFRCFAFYSHGKKSSSSGASKRFVKGGTSKKSLEIPVAVEKAISELADQKDLTLMIMGQANTGKSTLARYAVNSLLNQHRRVAFLECDVGQTEFTPSGVVSMAFVSQPLIGPPCTHQRAPERAYFIGDSSPMQQPDLYICSINSLMQYFVGRKEPMPLVVNTCGWLRDLGSCIFWDLLRLISPSHVIHLHGDKDSGFQGYWFRDELVPINAFKNCHHSPGWLLTLPNSCNEPYPPDLDNQLHPPSSCNHPCSPSSNSQPHPSVVGTSEQRGSHVGQVQSESQETTQHSTGSDTAPAAIPEASEWVNPAQEDSKRILTSTSRKLKLKRLLNKKKKTVKFVQPSLNRGKALSRKLLHRVKSRDNLLKGPHRTKRQTHKQTYKVTCDTSWKSCGIFQFFSHLVNPYNTQTSSKALREIAMAVYFAQLNDETSSIIPWPELLLAATPYEIKWDQLAVHCLTVEVPHSQILYAINGMVVGLTKVDPSIIVDSDGGHHEMVKFLNERIPMAEYIGYGLVRGVDMKEKLFYITTPEPQHRLEQVNCLMLGKNELPSSICACSKKHSIDNTQPYISGNLPKMAIAKPFRGRPV